MAGQDQAATLPLAEEEIRVDKEPVVTGKVRVSSRVETVEEIASLTLAEERVEVTRVPVGREVTVAPSIRTEGDVTIVPVLEEVMVVEKKLFLKEELHVRRVVAHEAVEVAVKLRKQRGVVERVSAGPDFRDDEENRT